MADAGELALSTFSGHVDEPFRLLAGDELELALRLTEAEGLGEPHSPGLRAPFSLIFRGPSEPIVGQGTYRLRHATLGALELFLVPLRPDAAGARYQAIFN
jgi:hypothetical protein